MTEINGTALAIARTYVDAIANKDVDKIMSISAEDIGCMSPLGQIGGCCGLSRVPGGPCEDDQEGDRRRHIWR